MKGVGKILLVGSLVVLLGAVGCEDDDDDPSPGGGGGAGGTSSMNPDGGGGRGGQPSTATIAYTFDTDLQGFTFDRYQDPAPGAVTNLAAPRSGGAAGAPGAGADGGAPATGDGGAPTPPVDGGVAVPPGPPPTLEHDPGVGDPAPGSIKVTVPFTAFNQVVDAGRRLPIANVENWTGKTLRVKVRLSEGTFNGGAVLYVLTLNPPSPMYLYEDSAWTPLLAGQWTEITLNLATLPTADKIVGFGVQFGSGGPALPGATFTPSTPVFHIDSLTD